MHGIRNSKSKIVTVLDTIVDKAERKAAKHRVEIDDRRNARIEMSRLRGSSIAHLGEY